jgi:hypothetical protein
MSAADSSLDTSADAEESSVLVVGEEVAAAHEASVIECPPTPEHVPAGSSTPPRPPLAASRSGGHASGNSRKRKVTSRKGIVSRKFDMLFWCRWIDKYFLHLFYCIRFFKMSSFSCRIFGYKTFRGRFFIKSQCC